MKRILLVGLLVGIALAVIGAEPVKVIMATTDDGRRVILMPDGKWNFVEGAPEVAKPPSKAAGDGCKEKVWKDIVSYFYQWKISQSEKDSFLLKTDWTEDQSLHTLVPCRVKVSLFINDDCSLKIDTSYKCKIKQPPTGPDLLEPYRWEDQDLNELQKLASVKSSVLKGMMSLGALDQMGPTSAKQVLDYDAKMKADLNALPAKYKPQSSPQP